MSSKFRVRLNLDGFESRVVPSGTTGDEPVQVGELSNDVTATPRIQINLQPCAPTGDPNLPNGAIIRVKVTAGGVTYDEQFTVNGPTTPAQQMEIILNDMKRQGWDAAIVGGQIVVYGHRDPNTGVYTPVSSGGASAGGAGQLPGALQPGVVGNGGATVEKLPQPKTMPES